MASFEAYYPKLLTAEGGYASADYAAKNGDKGGETYLGIARNYNKDWAGWPLIDAYKKKNGVPKWNSKIKDPEIDRLAKETSKKIYWDKLKLDQVKNQSLAEYIMDFGFNSGLATPVKAVQELLGLKKDGVIGGDTINKINAADQKKLFTDLQDYRIKFVSNIKTLKPDVIQGLIKRAKSFAFDNKETINTVAKTVGLGFFFWIVLGIIVFGVLYYKGKIKI